jgi:L-fuconolactonase
VPRDRRVRHRPLPVGTDWTRAINFLTLKQGVDAFRATNRISESDKLKLMGANTARLYGWSPPKP